MSLQRRTFEHGLLRRPITDWALSSDSSVFHFLNPQDAQCPSNQNLYCETAREQITWECAEDIGSEIIADKPMYNSFHPNSTISDLDSFVFQFAIGRSSPTSDCSGNVSFTVSCEDAQRAIEYSDQKPFNVSSARPATQLVMQAKPLVRHTKLDTSRPLFREGFILLLLVTALALYWHCAPQPMTKLWAKAMSYLRSTVFVPRSQVAFSQIGSQQNTDTLDDADSEDFPPDVFLAYGARQEEHESTWEPVGDYRHTNSFLHNVPQTSVTQEPYSEEDDGPSSEDRPAIMQMKNGAQVFSSLSQVLL